MHLHMAKIKHVKYFIGYETDNKIILLFNNVPQVTGWKKNPPNEPFNQGQRITGKI